MMLAIMYKGDEGPFYSCNSRLFFNFLGNPLLSFYPLLSMKLVEIFCYLSDKLVLGLNTRVISVQISSSNTFAVGFPLVNII